MGAVLDIYKDLGLLERTVVFVTALNGAAGREEGKLSADGVDLPRLPWIAWGAGIKGHRLTQSVSIIETGATVMRALGLEIYTDWESRAVGEIFIAPHTASVGHAH